MKRLGHQLINGKAVWKPGIGEIDKASRGIVLEPHKWCLQHPIWILDGRNQRADAPWVIAYEHKTQSFMKNGG